MFDESPTDRIIRAATIVANASDYERSAILMRLAVLSPETIFALDSRDTIPTKVEYIDRVVYKVISESDGNAEWQRHAINGRKIDAIKAYREQHGVSLREGKDAIEAWMGQTPIASD